MTWAVDVMAIRRDGSVEPASKGGPIGGRFYDTVVLPPFTDNLDRRTWDLLDEFVATGGKVISCLSSLPRKDGSVPQNSAPTWSSRAQKMDATQLPGSLRGETEGDGFSITRKTGDKGILFHMRRELDDGDLPSSWSTRVSMPPPRAALHPPARRGTMGPRDRQGQRYGFRPVEPGECGPTSSFRPAAVWSCSSPRRLGNWAAADGTLFQLGAVGPVEIKRLDPNVLVLDYVDITAGGETRTNLYFYQASQFAFQKNGMERNPWDSAVQFKDELIRRQFPADSGFKATYRFQIGQKVPAPLAIVIERPDLYTITCNGQPVRATPGAWWLDKAFGRIELAGAARVGVNEVTLSAMPFTIFHEVEPAYVLGDFTLGPSGNGFVILPDRPLQLGRWNEQGHPFYAAGVSYKQRFNLGDVPMGEFVVKLPDWRGSVAKVLVNGTVAGYIGHAPWQCNVTHEIWNGENTVEVVAVGTLKNTLGPHHGKPGLGAAWPGSFQKGPMPGPPPGRSMTPSATACPSPLPCSRWFNSSSPSTHEYSPCLKTVRTRRALRLESLVPVPALAHSRLHGAGCGRIQCGTRRAPGLVARGALRDVRPLGPGEPPRHRDRLVARQGGAGRGVRRPLPALRPHPLRRPGVGTAREGRGHGLPRPHHQAPRRLLPVAERPHRLRHRDDALPARRRARALGRLPRRGHRLLRLPLDLRLAAPGLPAREPRRQAPARPRRTWTATSAYLKGQLAELLQSYGPLGDALVRRRVGGALDGGARARTSTATAGPRSPSLIVNNRVARAGRTWPAPPPPGPSAGTTTPPSSGGPLPGRPAVGVLHHHLPAVGVEARRPMKTLDECVRTLVTCAGGDGNLLLNVGPMPTGEIEPRQVQRLQEMGQWLSRYGHTIYNTRGGPFKPGAWGASTCRANSIYLHVFDWPDDGLRLPALPRKILSSQALTGGSLKVNQTEAGLVITLPPANRQDVVTVLELNLDGPAQEIPPVAVFPSSSAPAK